MRYPLYLLLITGLMLAACGGTDSYQGPQVIVYTDIDRKIAEPIFKDARKVVRQEVVGVYAEKGRDLLQELEAGKDDPKADVFWSLDPGRAILLKQKGLTAPFEATGARGISEHYRDAERHWISFSGRGMVLLVNSDLITNPLENRSIDVMTDPRWRGRVAIANPLQGPTHYFFAAVFEALGDQKAMEWLEGLKANKVKVLPSEVEVKRQVSAGQFAIGLLDSTNAIEVKEHGSPVRVMIPDQVSATGRPLGALLVPNTLALMGSTSNITGAKRAIDYLLSSEVAEELANEAWQAPLRPGDEAPSAAFSTEGLVTMNVKPSQVAQRMETIRPILENWLQQL